MSNFPSLPKVPLVDAKGNMHVQWQGYFTSLNRALDALGGVPPTPTSSSVLAAAYKGNWSAIVTYFPGDEVSFRGNLFRSLIETLNVTPINGADWLLIGPLTQDWLADGGTYARVKATGLTSGVVNTTGLTSNAATFTTQKFTAGPVNVSGSGSLQSALVDSFTLPVQTVNCTLQVEVSFNSSIGSVAGTQVNSLSYGAASGNEVDVLGSTANPVSQTLIYAFSYTANAVVTINFNWAVNSPAGPNSATYSNIQWKAEFIKR